MDDKLEYIKAELDTLGTAFGETRKARMDAIRTYFVMLGVIPVVLGLVLDEELVSLLNKYTETDKALLFTAFGACVVANVSGFFILLQVLGLRLEEILYARSINALRAYVILTANDDHFTSAFALPSRDDHPDFGESWDRPARIILYLMLFVNVLLVYGGLAALHGAFQTTLTSAMFLLSGWGWAALLLVAVFEVTPVFLIPHIRNRDWESPQAELQESDLARLNEKNW